MILKLGMKHQAMELYKVYINHDPGMTGPSPRFKKWSGGRYGRVSKVREGESTRGARGGEHERGLAPSRKGGSGDLPRENFDKLVPLKAF